MLTWFAGLLQRVWRVPSERTLGTLHIIGAVVAASLFVSISTVLVAYESLFLGANNVASLRVGDSAPQDIRAPMTLTYISDVLTEQSKDRARASVPEIYFPPDPSVSRQQTDLAQQILAYIQDIRRDPYGTTDQKTNDLHQITDLALDDNTIVQLLSMDDKTWSDVSDQITNVLERVMRGEIRESNLPTVIAQLPMQVSVRFSEAQSNVIVAVVRDLIRPNTRLNEAATRTARDEAVSRLEPVQRRFERGQVFVRAGERIDAAGYEALDKLGLLQPADRRLQDIFRALLASVLVLVMMGLFISRFAPSVLTSSRFMVLLASVFLLTLFGERLSGLYGQIYLFPAAALAMLYVALSGPGLAAIGMVGLGALVGLMENNSLELAMLVVTGGLMAALTLRRPERLNSYFMPGALVALTNAVIVTIFYQGENGLTTNVGLSELLLYSALNGILSATVALAAIYVLTALFNMPTGIRLVELSQPNQPLLQRLLREAPGTYQHSLQVANLGEQAASAIGVNADLVRVAALYHDIGKIMNPPFFTENQVEGVNPHDVLDDPFRSADIIISHVTDGDRLARQYRLPARLRDFILEHHGTQVLYFYEIALKRAANKDEVDIEQFTYPGPKPQTKETGILMLADSCEAAVRSRKPIRKQDITDTIQQIFEHKVRTGQLDDSGLTLGDIKVIRRIFNDMLQAVFHPRITYPATVPGAGPEVTPATPMQPVPPPALELTPEAPHPDSGQPVTQAFPSAADQPRPAATQEMAPVPRLQTREVPPVKVEEDGQESEDMPLPDVPPLPRTGEHKAVRSNDQEWLDETEAG
jgi:putative nucleotidyltransferase with HDIG domain